MNRVLMVSYAYPPMSSPGALRSSKFAKYLPHHGWEPVVITPREGFSRFVGLGGQQQSGVTVVRTGDIGGLKRAAAGLERRLENRSTQRWPTMGSLARRLLFPDRDAPWYPFAMHAALRTIRQGGVRVLYSTSPSVTNHMIALHLSRLTGLPWIADYRDPWTAGKVEKGFRRRLDRALDHAIHNRATQLLQVSEFNLEQAAATFPAAAGKMVVLCNGYDAADFQNLPEPPGLGEPFVLTYSGWFYGGQRDPRGLFAAIAGLAREGVLTRENFRLDLVGQREPIIAEMARRVGVEALVNHVGRLTYRETLERLGASSALVVLTRTTPRARGELTTKLYEYIGVGRPVLALTPPDFEMARVMAQADAGACIHPDDAQGIAAWLREAVNSPRVTGFLPVRAEAFTRATGAAQLARLLDEVVAGYP
jgi:glycosyltransferase involved in cell wall biosynthesis